MEVQLRKKLKTLKSQVFLPPPDFTISEWADEHRFLSPEACATPGKWDTSNAEYTREILDTISNPDYENICIKSAAQVSKTETILNTCLYYITNSPCSILLLQPTIKAAQDFSKERLSPALRDCKLTKNIFDDIAHSDNLLNKKFPGGFLALGGANKNTVSGRPIRVLLMDEISRFPEIAGEGSAIRLAIQRTSNFFNRKIIAVSTPTDENCLISALYDSSDQREYNLKCIHCEEHFIPNWEQVKWVDNEIETALIHCPHCGSGITDSERKWGIRHGKWTIKYPERKKAGFHLNALSSPWTKLSSLVEEYIECKKDTSLMRTFVNTKLGLQYLEDGETIDAGMLSTHIIDYTSKSIPKECLLLVAGCDIQADRIEILVTGFGDNSKSWHIEHKVIFCDTSTIKPFDTELKDYLINSKFVREDCLPLKISATAVDSGYNTQIVYQFCRKNLKNRFYAVKGRSGNGHLLFPKRSTKSKLGGNVFLLGVDTGKSEVYANLRIHDENESGYCYFNQSCDQDFFDQLTSETFSVKYKNGRPYRAWAVKQGVRNEILDMRVYCLAMKYMLNPNWSTIKKQQEYKLSKLDTEQTITETITESVEQEPVDNLKPTQQKISTRKRIIKRRTTNSSFLV